MLLRAAFDCHPFWRRCCAASLSFRAGNGTRTRDPTLGKVVLYQLSYSREADGGTGNDRPRDPSVSTPNRRYSSGAAMEARGIEPLTS